MSAPWKPLQAVIKIGTTEIGAAIATASSLSFARDIDEYYGLGGGGKPKLVKGNQHFSGRLRKAYFDKTYADIVMGGTPVDIVFYPEGKVSGKQTVTAKNCLFRNWDFTMDQDAVVAEDLPFVGDDLVFGTAE